MGFLDTLKRLLGGETISIGQSSATSTTRRTRTSTFTETLNGQTQTTTIEVQQLDGDWTHLVNGTVYQTLGALPESLRARVNTLVAEV